MTASFAAPKAAPTSTTDWDRGGLPAWTYFDPSLAKKENDVFFRRHWQLACHVSDVPNVGDFITLDIVGERAIVIRDRDGEIKAFNNLCRHRGSRVLAEARGNRTRVLTCPFHGWCYNFDGTLRRPAAPESLPDLDPVDHGLKPLDHGIWMGFVFIRFLPGEQRAPSEAFGRHDAEVLPYDTANMVAAHDEFSITEMPVNWKSVRDVDNEGYHVPIAHPSLQDLYGPNYFDDAYIDETTRSHGALTDAPGRSWSVRHYKKILPERPTLPAENRRAWLYVGIFPTTVIGFYPDSTIFYQEFPIAVDRTIQRSGAYRYKDEDRALKLSRYLSGRIDRVTGREDNQLIEWCFEATKSSAYDDTILSDRERGVREYHDILRRKIPDYRLKSPPAG
jgi:phenylpropionate dioxygenase-like ring-hydroxylating dioxygenase large terminal subunit